MNRLWIGAVTALVLTLIVGGIGWKAKWLEIKLGNERVEKQAITQEKDLGETLYEGLDDYNRNSSGRRQTVDESIDRIHDAVAPLPDGDNGLLARMRRADAAWRSGVVELCPECAPGGSGDSAGGEPEELPGRRTSAGQ